MLCCAVSEAKSCWNCWCCSRELSNPFVASCNCNHTTCMVEGFGQSMGGFVPHTGTEELLCFKGRCKHPRTELTPCGNFCWLQIFCLWNWGRLSSVAACSRSLLMRVVCSGMSSTTWFQLIQTLFDLVCAGQWTLLSELEPSCMISIYIETLFATCGLSATSFSTSKALWIS